MGLRVAGIVAVFYGMVYVDVVLRARHAWLEGEQYWHWSDHPDERAAFVKEKYVHEKAELDKKKDAGKIVKEDYDRDAELLAFAEQQELKESTIKYAYVWYQTAVDLFSPPESKWVRLSREKMPLAKERWKAELTAQKVPFDEASL